jgi:hypothetical protein
MKILNRIRSLNLLVSDWNISEFLLISHGVAALVWYNLEKLNLLSGIPEEVVATIS